MNPIYDSIGQSYNQTRRAEPRITARLVALLGLPAGSRVIDIGAGSGNYSAALAEHGFEVTALEPSAVMRAQGRRHDRLQWQEGVAEELPFADGTFDGAVMTLCLHHMTDWRRGIAEALRVIGNGPLLIFTFDIERKAQFWLDDYFPELVKIDAEWGFTIDDICSCIIEQGRKYEIESFPVPRDIQDHFLASGWARPEIYLDEKYRKGISSFSRIGDEALHRGLNALQQDLQSGHWQECHGELKTLDALDLGYLFIRVCQD